MRSGLSLGQQQNPHLSSCFPFLRHLKCGNVAAFSTLPSRERSECSFHRRLQATCPNFPVICKHQDRVAATPYTEKMSILVTPQTETFTFPSRRDLW